METGLRLGFRRRPPRHWPGTANATPEGRRYTGGAALHRTADGNREVSRRGVCPAGLAYFAGGANWRWMLAAMSASFTGLVM